MKQSSPLFFSKYHFTSNPFYSWCNLIAYPQHRFDLQRFCWHLANDSHKDRTKTRTRAQHNGHLQHAVCNIDAPVHISRLVPWAPRTETRNARVHQGPPIRRTDGMLAGVYLIPRQGLNRRRDGSRLGACVQGSALCRRILVFLYSGIVVTVSFVG